LSNEITPILNDLSPEARAAAERAAEAAGIPIEQWLARVILRTSAGPRSANTATEPVPEDNGAAPAHPYVATRGSAPVVTPQLTAIRRYIASVSRSSAADKPSTSVSIELLERRIAQSLGVECVIRERNGAGTISLHYRGAPDRVRLLTRLGIGQPDR
jgi:hypothetical protein